MISHCFHMLSNSKNRSTVLVQQPSSAQKPQPSVQTKRFLQEQSGGPHRSARGGRTSQGSGAGRGSGSTSGLQRPVSGAQLSASSGRGQNFGK